MSLSKHPLQPFGDFLQLRLGRFDGRPARFPVSRGLTEIVGIEVTTGVEARALNPIEIAVVNNDSDPEGWPLRLPANPFVSLPTKGNVRRLSDGTIEYTPLPNASGADSFQYKVEDSFGLPATATVSIQIMEGIFLP